MRPPSLAAGSFAIIAQIGPFPIHLSDAGFSEVVPFSKVMSPAVIYKLLLSCHRLKNGDLGGYSSHHFLMLGIAVGLYCL